MATKKVITLRKVIRAARLAKEGKCYCGGIPSERAKPPQQWHPLTRGGYEYRIYATDGAGENPIHGALKRGQAGWFTTNWRKDGRWIGHFGEKEDLLPMPKTKAKTSKGGAK